MDPSPSITKVADVPTVRNHRGPVVDDSIMLGEMVNKYDEDD